MFSSEMTNDIEKNLGNQGNGLGYSPYGSGASNLLNYHDISGLVGQDRKKSFSKVVGSPVSQNNQNINYKNIKPVDSYQYGHPNGIPPPVLTSPNTFSNTVGPPGLSNSSVLSDRNNSNFVSKNEFDELMGKYINVMETKDNLWGKIKSAETKLIEFSHTHGNLVKEREEMKSKMNAMGQVLIGIRNIIKEKPNIMFSAFGGSSEDISRVLEIGDIFEKYKKDHEKDPFINFIHLNSDLKAKYCDLLGKNESLKNSLEVSIDVNNNLIEENKTLKTLISKYEKGSYSDIIKNIDIDEIKSEFDQSIGDYDVSSFASDEISNRPDSFDSFGFEKSSVDESVRSADSIVDTANFNKKTDTISIFFPEQKEKTRDQVLEMLERVYRLLNDKGKYIKSMVRNNPIIPRDFAFGDVEKSYYCKAYLKLGDFHHAKLYHDELESLKNQLSPGCRFVVKYAAPSWEINQNGKKSRKQKTSSFPQKN